LLWELALFSILVPAGYFGILHARRRPFGTATYGVMLIATAALAGIALLGQRAGAGWADLVGAIALGAGSVQLVIAPMLRGLARWAVATDRLDLAAVLVDVRDLLQPGMGGRDDKRTVRALRDVRDGRIDQTIASLEAMRERAPADARRTLDERIVMLYLSAHRWADALAHADQRLDAGEVSSGLAVELAVARLRAGDLDGAATLIESVLAAAKAAPELILLVYRLHLVYLAHLGRVVAVERLLEPQLATYVTPAARRYWLGVARHAAGDVPGARAAFGEARALAGRDRRARALIDESAAAIDEPAPTPSQRAAALADRMSGSTIVMPPRTPSRRNTVTAALIAGNLVVTAICALALEGAGDLGSIVRAGANVRGAVDAGQVWRLASATFVHVGWIHLAVNVLALWSLGRLVEGLFGSSRMLAIYGLAGIGGAAASHAMSFAGVSAGASGAIFGLLGAALVELALHRRRYRAEWRKSLLSALAVVTVAQLAIGLAWAMIDQWAHVGGLVAGAVAGAALSPGWRWAERPASVWAGRALAAAVVVGFAWSAIAAVRTDYAVTLAAEPRSVRALGDFEAELPDRWEITENEAVDLDLYVVLRVGAPPPDPEEAARADARERKFETVEPARDVRIPLPDGWRGRELIVAADDPLGSAQRYRMVVIDATFGEREMQAYLYVPDALSSSGAAELGRIVATLRPR
jgi:membrane associated rhomboid family serine protease